MQRSFLVAFAIALLAATSVFAADALSWPWKSKMPPDPALVVLPKVESLTATVDKDIVTIAVKAMAPTAGFSEFNLTPRIGDPKDRIFAFDIRGRAPQESAAEVMTPISVDAAYKDAPIGEFDVIEIYGKDNCLAYSIKDAKQVDCISKSVPQDG